MMLWSETDLPTPLRPRMATISPGITVKLTSFELTRAEGFVDVFEFDVRGERIGRQCWVRSHH